MSERRVGLWMIGAYGGVASTAALGLAATAKGLASSVGMVTALPEFQHVPFDDSASFVVGGHDIRQSSLGRAVAELHSRSNVFSEALLTACLPTLDEWSRNVRPGVVYRPNAAIAALADRPDVVKASCPREAITQIQSDLRSFQRENRLDQLIVANVASTEPLFEPTDELDTLAALQTALDRASPPALPTSSVYAFAAIDAGFPYVNITPSIGATIPAIEQLAIQRGVPIAGQDLKTGETLLKSVLAPLFKNRNLKILSWVGHNILGNRDGLVLNDPQNKQSKLKTKDSIVAQLLGYKPQTHTSIEYIESLDDWKTAWDHIHFEGFLGAKMTLQFTWQGCDSLLAAPLLLDVAKLLALAQRRSERGTVKELAVFFKSPVGLSEHNFVKQMQLLEQYLSPE
jgi:myo-inositol-1-phosphate synthase